MKDRLGFSGRLARSFLTSALTPLLALTAMLMGLFAVAVTPREEEPQIDVTFANIFIPFPGASAAQVESLVASPMEKVPKWKIEAASTASACPSRMPSTR